MKDANAPAPMEPRPLPENWNEMTGNERYQHLASGWAATQGIPFESPELAEKYRKRAQRIVDVVALKEPDEVPVFFMADGFVMENGGILPVDAFYNPEKYFQAIFKAHGEYEIDYSLLLGVLSGKAFDKIGLNLIRWPGSSGPNVLPDDTAFQYVEDEYMRADEYDELINNVEGYIVRKYLPRICSELTGLSTIPCAVNFTEATNITGPLAAFSKGSPARQALEALFAAADESMKMLMPFMGAAMQLIGKFGTPCIFGGGTFVPYDLLGDTMRCTMGIMKDLYRRPEKVIAATQALVPMAVKMAVDTAMLTRNPYIIVPLHKGADGFMSPEQFEKFYWPTLKATFLGMMEAGLVPIPFVEGAYNQRLDIIAADPLPKGRTIWMFDRTEMNAAKEKIGHWGCIAGNVPASLFKQGSPQDLEKYCKNLIETCAPGGGFFLTPGAVIDQANPENVKVFLNSGRKFGKY